MNELQVFSNPEFGAVRSMMIEDAPWFVGRDVTSALGYAKAQNALKTHVNPDDALIRGIIDNLGRTQRTTIINESGLYSLILSSKLPSAKRFKRWVTSEVLPALRRTGRYEVPGSGEATPVEGMPERTTTRDDYLRAASIVATCRNERLPYVLSYLKQAGIEATAVMEDVTPAPIQGECAKLRSQPTEQERLEVIRLLNAAREKGYGDSDLAKRLGAHKNDVRRWRIAEVTPRAKRIAHFKEVLEPLVNQAE